MSHVKCILMRKTHTQLVIQHRCLKIFEAQGLDGVTRPEEDTDLQDNHVQSGSSPLNGLNGADVEAVDYENNGLIWLPPEPEDEEDDRGALISDGDDDDAGDDATGEWGYLRSSSFLVGECRSRDKSNEEHRKAMKRVVEAHFRALITQLLQAENLPATEHESCMVVKGVVCKKNVAHRRMTSKIDKARLLLLGGALEYQRVANHLSSFDTLLQQWLFIYCTYGPFAGDLAVAGNGPFENGCCKNQCTPPNILLVEKSVSRYAQEYLLAKNISLVLNIKRPLLERIARCTGAQIVPSIDTISAPKLGCCDSFHVEKFLEDLGAAGQGGKKSTKTLMFLKVALGHWDVLCFSARTPLQSPIKVQLPDKPPSIDRSISMVSGCSTPSSEMPQAQTQASNAFQSKNELFDIRQSSEMVSIFRYGLLKSSAEQLLAVHYSKEHGGGSASGQGFSFSPGDGNEQPSNLDSSELVTMEQHTIDHPWELGTLKEEFAPSPSDHQSILVSLSTRCVWKGSSYRCRSCEMPSEAHVHCYTHQQGSLTISVKKLQEFLLPGEREGKIWMWHRCLRCPKTNGFPRLKRVVMSDAAWGLSFGKFWNSAFQTMLLHAGSQAVFWEDGCMFSLCSNQCSFCVSPTPKVEFNYYKQEWIQKEFDEVRSRAGLLFTEVLEVLHQILDKVKNDTGTKATDSSQQIAELELMLQKEKREFEESLWCVLNKDVKSGQPEIDILEINRLKRQLVLHSYVWDQRFVHVSRSIAQSSSSSILKEKPVNYRDKRTEMDAASSSPSGIPKGAGINRTLSNKQDSNHYHHSSVTNLLNQSEVLEFGKTVRRARSEGQFPVMEYKSDNLDAAMTGNHQPAIASPNTLPRESSSGMISTTVGPVGNYTNDGFEAYPLSSVFPAKGPSDIEDPSSWLRIPFSALYRSFNHTASTNAQKLGKISEYSPVYISSFRELVHQGGARLLLPMSSCDTIVPIYDDEPTSIISYTLVSPDYQNLMSGEPEKQKDSLKSSSSFSILDSVNLLSLHSFDESHSESLRSLTSADESLLSSASRSFLGLDPLPNPLHARVSFSDDGPPGKVKYTVTCYFAQQFEALRSTCCASELDFIRSLSRCKKWVHRVWMPYLPCKDLRHLSEILRLYDLKGSSRSRYNPDSSGSNKVLLDQNLIEAMPTSPIFLGTKAKRLLERAVWNDTSFLASIDVMDYSLLVGVDEEKHELVLGIIDFMRQYTWDKHLETWVKASGILGPQKCVSDNQWPSSSSMIPPSGSLLDVSEENLQYRVSTL
ncbi:hypothetical protein DH2020_018463 [Rehmannia glutinosa]|uniref:1-phosphatidylinositol-3-phosphate 5-kinase n=1 Tax=Rehmannia glutinosa TaxID=99300 RepID=A0ABR0WKZ9_REHGL